MKVVAIVVALASAGCLRSTSYKCGSNDQCSGTGGVCEDTGFCSFTDGNCNGGRRYGEFSGVYANKCVGDVLPIDGGLDVGDGPMGDVPVGGCPASYAALPGVTGHVYRVITTTALWDTQGAACMADQGTTYLAVPDDQAELDAIITASSVALTWVGIDDKQTENTFVTATGGAFSATSPLWHTADSSEPDNAPSSGGGGADGADCVAADDTTNNLADDRCDTKMYRAVCECEP